MNRYSLTVGSTTVDYFKKGLEPKLLIHAGTHGNEHEVIESVKRAVEKYEKYLPDFIFVPVVSPSAVAKRTRRNKDGVDLNRHFKPGVNLEEIKANLEILGKYHFDLSLTFHEDPEVEDFYIYDTVDLTTNQNWHGFAEELTTIPVGLFSGIDDPEDPTLNNHFQAGCQTQPQPSRSSQLDGSLFDWLWHHGQAKRVSNPEIPGPIALDTKHQIVDAFFRHMVLA